MWRYVRRCRSRLEVAVEVLKACLIPTIPTRMMYASNTSWNMFKEILEALIDKCLIERKQEAHQDRRRLDRRLVGFYIITEKGLRS